jgi:hypothetical protein
VGAGGADAAGVGGADDEGDDDEFDDELELDAVDQVADRLIARNPSVNPAYIEQLVDEQYEHLLSARLRDYLPLLVEHQVKEKLRREREKREAGLL